jgi:2-iminobutanoate/2-iminopropanoate deaminase
MVSRIAINTPAANTISGPWSHGVRVGPLLFTSGQVPINPATNTVESADVAMQVRQSLQNVEAILAAGGATAADIAKVTVYLRDYADFAAVNEEYERHFAAPYPARTLVTVASLPIVKGVLCRCIIEAIAYVGPTVD